MKTFYSLLVILEQLPVRKNSPVANCQFKLWGLGRVTCS